jgi:hypothetical protein
VIPANHPLRGFFNELVLRHFHREERAIASYVAAVLVDFTHVANLYRIRNARGRWLEDVGEMLVESNPLLAGRSFVREREVRKHIGDYTLFMSGLFPEYVASLPRRGLRLDAFVDYLKAGKESYRIVAAFGDDAALFLHLSERFEMCVYGLNLVKADLERYQSDYYRQLRLAV